MRLAIITTHPIQYYAPVFKLLHQRGKIQLNVFYTWGKQAITKHDPGFDKTVEWDIPLLEGYPFSWVKNTAVDAGSHHFKGIINPDLIADIDQWKPDAVLVFGWAYHSHLKVLRYFKDKIPVYFRGDSTLLDIQPGIKSLLRTVFLKWVYKHVDTAFYVGTNNQAYFKQYGLLDEQLIFSPHAVDNDRFVLSRKTESDKLRADLGVNADDILILFAGKLENKKSPALLLDAFLKLNAPNAHLLFTGSGNLSELLQQKAATNKNVHFIGFQNQAYMPVVYQACDVFCLPSKGPGETWGLAVNEAMACGKAIIAANKVGCAINLVQQQNGIIFESENINELLTALRTLVADKPGLKKMGVRSAQIISNYTFLAIAKAIEAKCIQH
ncbi:glycosyltransferase family 4 protein [Inquilinus sp. KBS0705]|nr:glycosyltransferase family 4 protein [Inquilinus sp. KBS0705]